MPVAASTVLAPILSGRPRPLTVVVGGASAAYLRDDGGVVAVHSADSVPASCGLLLPPGRGPDVLFHPGQTVLAGHGFLQTASHRLLVTRWWPPASVGPPATDEQVPLPPAPRELLRALLSDAGPSVDEAALQARNVAVPAAVALAGGDIPTTARLLTGVLGLGPGLTPSGDDVAAGILLVLFGVLGGDCPNLERLASTVVAAARSSTTTVSVALLTEAAAGRTSVPVARAVRALLGRPFVGTPADAFAALLALGHLSGADLATGMLAAADAFAAAPLQQRRSA
ncbi:MAG: DUF2877 domain-containing protein [Actinomycetes bacterium]